jgi:hypothetical protein
VLAAGDDAAPSTVCVVKTAMMAYPGDAIVQSTACTAILILSRRSPAFLAEVQQQRILDDISSAVRRHGGHKRCSRVVCGVCVCVCVCVCALVPASVCASVGCCRWAMY